MALLKILEIPNPLLKKKCALVPAVTDEIRQTLSDMLETMYDAPGVGLAAPQIGLLQRMVVIDASGKNETPCPYKMVNPVIIEKSPETVLYEEGCLSVPEQYAEVERFEKVTVQYTDENGQNQILKAEGLLAIAVQHELDHLDGKLFIDRLSKLKRDIIKRKVDKIHRFRQENEKEKD